MKKFALLSLACASLLSASPAFAQEVTYVEDCSQGILLNRMKDNWFITLQGGGNFMFSNHDREAKAKNRFGGTAGLFVGKWFSPIIGLRAGASWNYLKGATTAEGFFRDMNKSAINAEKGFYPERFMAVGPEVNVMINLTNWWCGYRPNRVYNAVLHGGGGAYVTLDHKYRDGEIKWHEAQDKTLFANLGLQNNFRLSKHFDFFVDVACTIIEPCYDDLGGSFRRITYIPQAEIGFTYKFNKTDWNCPVTAVCPTWKYTDAEGDALVARLANADAKVNDLQRQLDNCLNRPRTSERICEDELATIYYPINVSSLSPREKKLVSSLAEVMKQNSDKKYILTGWADNYTGNNEINTRLRNERVNGVANYLRKCGVPASQFETRIDDKNLTDFGVKGAPFDRAVTIMEAK